MVDDVVGEREEVVAWRERASLSKLFALRRDDVAPPAALMLGFLAATAGLFLLQGTSPNTSSIRERSTCTSRSGAIPNPELSKLNPPMK